MIVPFGERRPEIDPSAVVFPSAWIIGDTRVGAESSIWFGAVVRADVDRVTIGARTSIQDRCVVHVTTKRFSTEIGDEVTVGHGATLHGCRVGNRVLVGIGAILLDGCEIGDDCIVAAGTLVPPKTVVPAGFLVKGSPSGIARRLTYEEVKGLRKSADNYVKLSTRYRELGLA